MGKILHREGSKMMFSRIIKKDLLKNKTIAIVLLIFIALSSLLVATGTSMIGELVNSLHALFAKSSAPDFVQMHDGEINKTEIEQWSTKNPLVKQEQIVEMITIDGTKIGFGSQKTIEKSSIMDNYIVTQNQLFDYLLNLNNDIIQVSKGEIAVPVYYMQKNKLDIGDTITIMNQEKELELVISDFVRDVQMNPSIIHSKRFVVHEADWQTLKQEGGKVEYSIEFQLTDSNNLNDFRNAYESSNLPKKGPVIDYPLFKALNAITDGLVVAIIIIISTLLIIIAILCIQYTILAAIEEDYKEIGIMKAIGISRWNIKKLYLLKYIVLTAVASLIGYVISFFLSGLFMSNIKLYLGTSPKSMLLHIAPLLAVSAVFVIIILFCLFTFRKFNRITAVEALRTGSYSGKPISNKSLSLHKWSMLNVNVYLGIRDIMMRYRMYLLLLFVYLISTFIIIVPVNFLNTVQSSSFIKYLGIERSDIRVDLQQADPTQETFNAIVSYVKRDQDVDQYAPLVTSRFEMMNDEGLSEAITIETGDFSMFPLEYIKGTAPTHNYEIALSYLNSDEFEKDVGDQLQLIINGETKTMVVSGIYQDVTNGGRTAKAILPYNPKTALSYVINIDLKSGVDMYKKMVEYENVFHPAKVTNIEGYLVQTFGNTIEQLRVFTIAAMIIALLIAALITSLFLRMLVAKDREQIAILKSIGFSLNDLRNQYITRTLLVLVVGMVSGTIIANTLGERIVSILLSFMGASEVSFVIHPVEAYLLCPFVLIVVVGVTALRSIFSIKKTTITELSSD